MGLLTKLFGLRIQCPECGRVDAKDGLGGVRCVNEHCRNFDAAYAQAAGIGDTDGQSLPREAFATMHVSSSAGAFQEEAIEFENVEEIEYLNFRGELRQFRIDADSILDKGTMLSVCVEPTGKRIGLKKASIKRRTPVPKT